MARACFSRRGSSAIRFRRAFPGGCSFRRSWAASRRLAPRSFYSERVPASPNARVAGAVAARDDPRGRLRVAVAARLRAAPLAPAARVAPFRRARRAAARLRPVKLALAHEYFVAHGGAERVVEALHRMWPEAPVYTFFHDR